MNPRNAHRTIAIAEALSELSLTVVADFFPSLQCGGLAACLRLAEVGVTVFPVGAVGEDAPGQEVLHKLHERRITTAGISKVAKLATPREPGDELIHGEHPVLLNLVEHARKFASASDAMFVCDHGIGAATPRVLNFIKSNGCLREKPLVARSRKRLVDFEQLTSAIATVPEMEQALEIGIGTDPEKFKIAGQGLMEGLQLSSFVAIDDGAMTVFRPRHKPESTSSSISADALDVFGAIFTAALAADAEPPEAAVAAAETTAFLASQAASPRIHRDALLAFLATPATPRRTR